MDPFDHAPVGEIAAVQKSIVDSLGLYRAEYTDVGFARVFTTPSYWQELGGRRPTFLVGGRGTGKTMALRMLAYDGQHALAGDDISQWQSIGIYWRIGVNAVSAFRGTRLSDADWSRLFSHYVNLQLVDRVLQFVAWRELALNEATMIDRAQLRRTALSLNLSPTEDHLELSEMVGDELARFEAHVNGIVRDVPEMSLSLLGAPLAHVLRAFQGDPKLAGRFWTICIDEFENLENYQQRVFNTLLKHVGDAPYTFKIGMKPTGLRDRHTLNPHESVSETADYSTVDIVETNKSNSAQSFSDFAAQVCEERFQLFPPSTAIPSDIFALFPDLSEEEEAELLGLNRKLASARDALVQQGANEAELRYFDALPKLSAYMVHYWAQSHFTSEVKALREAIERPGPWATRVGNYSFTMLFTIAPRVGPTTRKLYAGWSTLVALADGNIRYLLELVSTALLDHVATGQDLLTPVAPAIQTRAAHAVAQKLVYDLEGQDDLGRQILRVVQGLGRVFGVMASDPFGHAPEVTQFRIDRAREVPEGLDRLVEACVMHSAIVRFPGNKRAAASAETQEWDYQLHPIFSSFFLYSYRRKRRTSLSAQEFIQMSSAEHSNSTVDKILRRHKRVLDQYEPQSLFDFEGLNV